VSHVQAYYGGREVHSKQKQLTRWTLEEEAEETGSFKKQIPEGLAG